MRKRSISFSPPDIREEDINAVAETLRSGWITTGPKCKRLERKVDSYIRTGQTGISCDDAEEAPEYAGRAVCLSSATAAEELSLRIAGIGPGDEVIVPAYTYTSTASAAIHCGATVRFVDTVMGGSRDTNSPEMDYDQLEHAITEKTRAIIPVDIGGVMCSYDSIFDIVNRKKNLFKPKESDGTINGRLASDIQKRIGRVMVFADSAHSLGSYRIFKGGKKNAGTVADFTSFSLHAVKNLTTAEGGIAAWNDIDGIENKDIYRMYQLMSLHGQSRDAYTKDTGAGSWEYDIIGPWYKYNMTDVLASIGLSQIDRYESILRRRREIIDIYDRFCSSSDGITHLMHVTDTSVSCGHLYLIRIQGIDESIRNKIMADLSSRGIQTNVHYKPLPMMTAYGSDCSGYPGAWDYYHNLISLPLHTGLSDEDAEYICENLKDVIGMHR